MCIHLFEFLWVPYKTILAVANGQHKMSTPSNKNDKNFCQLRAVKIRHKAEGESRT